MSIALQQDRSVTIDGTTETTVFPVASTAPRGVRIDVRRAVPAGASAWARRADAPRRRVVHGVGR